MTSSGLIATKLHFEKKDIDCHYNRKRKPVLVCNAYAGEIFYNMKKKPVVLRILILGKNQSKISKKSV